MEGGEADEDGAQGRVWIACALCHRPVELSDSLDTVEGHVCPECAPDPGGQASRRPG